MHMSECTVTVTKGFSLGVSQYTRFHHYHSIHRCLKINIVSFNQTVQIIGLTFLTHSPTRFGLKILFFTLMLCVLY